MVNFTMIAACNDIRRPIFSLLQYFLLVLADDRLMLEIPFFGFKSLKYILCVCACPCVCVCVSVRARRKLWHPKRNTLFSLKSQSCCFGVSQKNWSFLPLNHLCKNPFLGSLVAGFPATEPPPAPAGH